MKPAICNPYVVWALAVWFVLAVFWTVNRKIQEAEISNTQAVSEIVVTSESVNEVASLTRN